MRAADEDLLLLASKKTLVRDGKPGKYLRKHGKVRAQRGAYRPGACSGGQQHARSANLFLIGPDQPPATVPFQGPDLPVTQERRAAALGTLEGREHGVLAAHVATLGIEEG